MALPRTIRASKSWLLRPILGVTVGGLTAGFVSYRIATHGQTFQEFDDKTDPLAQGRFGQAFNPYKNQTLSDIYVSRVPLEQIDSNLLHNAPDDSSRLIEGYATGLFGGWAFAVQRNITALKADKATSSAPNQLFDKEQIRSSRFEEGTTVGGELEVIEKTASSITFRGGSPANSEGLKEVDVLLQGLVDIDSSKGEAVFRLKCMFYTGNRLGAAPPLPEFMTPLHLMYARAMAANGVANCRK